MRGIYIHIPFCHSKCFYCDFYSTPRNDLFERFVDALIAEWEERHNDNEEFHTLYLGGGTPSTLPPSQLRRIFNCFSGMPFEEVTIEVNPEDVTREFLTFLKDTPVNRVSMGVQSTNDEELKRIGRRHSATQALDAALLIKENGFDLSLDLIYGLPGQTYDSWNRSLGDILNLRPDHLSAYLLSFEPNTRLSVMKRRGEVREATDFEAQNYYDTLCRTAAESGYEHYEISNFALPGKRALHNSNYWNLTPYLGLGPGAHSFDGRSRSYNPSNLKEYILAGGKGFNVKEQAEPNDALNDYLIIRLRTSDGLDLIDFEERFGEKATGQLRRELNRQLLKGLLISDGKKYRIPENHWLISDSIISSLLF